MKQAEAPELPITQMSGNNLRMIVDWEVGRAGLLLPASGEFGALYIWYGAFKRGETIAITTAEENRYDLHTSDMAVGVAREDDYKKADEDGRGLEVFAEAALNETAGGITGAIFLLEKLVGFPKV